MLAWFVLILSLCYVPHLVVYWAEIGAPLSPAQKILLWTSSQLSRSFLAMAPLLLLATGAALVWRIRTARQARVAQR